jgi:hypothetical protein
MPDLLIAKFGKKKPSKFADEGPPDMEETPRGSGAGVDDGDDAPMDDSDAAPMPDDQGGAAPPAADPEEQAADDLSDILGVGPEDRPDFGAALQAYVSACIAKALGGAGDQGDMGAEPMPEGPPGSEAP